MMFFAFARTCTSQAPSGLWTNHCHANQTQPHALCRILAAVANRTFVTLFLSQRRFVGMLSLAMPVTDPVPSPLNRGRSEAMAGVLPQHLPERLSILTGPRVDSVCYSICGLFLFSVAVAVPASAADRRTCCPIVPSRPTEAVSM